MQITILVNQIQRKIPTFMIYERQQYKLIISITTTKITFFDN